MIGAKSIYLIGSLRNPEIPKLAKLLRAKGHDVFDDWHAAGHDADDKWREYEQNRGRSFAEALQGYFVQHAFEFDKQNLDRVDEVVGVWPFGKSGFAEIAYSRGAGKRTTVLFNGEEPERWDMMLLFAEHFYMDWESFLNDY